MDILINDRSADLQAADRYQLEAARCGSDSASIPTVYHKDVEVARIAHSERSHATKVAQWREVWPWQNF